jgi:hypothetical protein
MENVVQFPTKDVRDWAIIERAMKESFASNGNVSSAVQTRLIERMKAFYEMVDPRLQISIDLATEVPPAAATALHAEIGSKLEAILNTQLQAYTKRLCIERLNHEIDVCRELGIW